MAKKQPVIEKEFTLDLSNISKVASGGKDVKEIPTEVPETQMPKENVKEKPEIKTKPPRKNRAVAKSEKRVIHVPKNEETTKKHLRLVVSQDHISEFESLFKRFVEETETYWTNTSRVHIFALGTLYLEQKYKKAKKHHKAPEDFISFISRKGNRLKTDESVIRKKDAKPMFFELEANVFYAYFNIIYSFLIERDDVNNLSYSGSYFFKDFLDLLNDNFKSFCTYGRKKS